VDSAVNFALEGAAVDVQFEAAADSGAREFAGEQSLRK